MSKFPLLDMLRADIARRDAAITAPVRQQLAEAVSVADGLRRSLRSLQHFIGREVAKHVIEAASHEMMSLIRREIDAALLKVGAKPGRPVHIRLDPMNAAFLDDRSLCRTVLDQYLDRLPDALSVDAVRQDVTATILDIRIPPIGYRQVVSDLN